MRPEDRERCAPGLVCRNPKWAMIPDLTGICETECICPIERRELMESIASLDFACEITTHMKAMKLPFTCPDGSTKECDSPQWECRDASELQYEGKKIDKYFARHENAECRGQATSIRAVTGKESNMPQCMADCNGETSYEQCKQTCFEQLMEKCRTMCLDTDTCGGFHIIVQKRPRTTNWFILQEKYTCVFKGKPFNRANTKVEKLKAYTCFEKIKDMIQPFIKHSSRCIKEGFRTETYMITTPGVTEGFNECKQKCLDNPNCKSFMGNKWWQKNCFLQIGDPAPKAEKAPHANIHCHTKNPCFLNDGKGPCAETCTDDNGIAKCDEDEVTANDDTLTMKG